MKTIYRIGDIFFDDIVNAEKYKQIAFKRAMEKMTADMAALPSDAYTENGQCNCIKGCDAPGGKCPDGVINEAIMEFKKLVGKDSIEVKLYDNPGEVLL